MSKNIWILNHHAELKGHRHYELAMRLAEQGYSITVVASSFSHSTHQYRNEEVCSVQEVQASVRYIWLRTTLAYQGNGIKRILNMVSYLRMVRGYARDWWNKYGKPDVVIGSSVHPLAWEAAYYVAKRTGAKFIAEVRDLWPLSLIEISGMSRYNPLVLFFGVLEKRAYRRAAKIFTTMPYAYKYICQEQYSFPRDKVVWVPNGIDTCQSERALADPEISLPPELDSYLRENWCCVYAGSLVKSECVDYIIDAASHLQEYDISFAIIGAGEEKDRLKEQVSRLGLNNVRFFGRISKDQVALALRLASCCLGAHHNLPIYRYGLSMNKLNDYLLSGTPTIFACAAPNVVGDSQGGISIEYGDPELLAQKILQVYKMPEEECQAMTAKGVREIKENYDIKAIAQKISEHL